MTDTKLFDDVDAILEEAEGLEEDKSFNESELQDIMSEIEDLEKEFIQEEAPMSLQEKIEAELAMEMEMGAFDTPVEVEIAAEEVKPVAQVLSFEKPATPTPAPVATTTTTSAGSQVAFQAQGSMALNLDFKVGEESAKLTIDPVKGLIVTVSGVELCISEDSGCTVSMENGMKFTIPLSTSNNSHKKKAA